jgi:hypothetical protein
LRRLGHAGQRRPAFEVEPVRIAAEREEVVPAENGVGPELVGLDPGRPQAGVVGVLRRNLDADLDVGH